MTTNPGSVTTSEALLPCPREGERRVLLNFYYDGGVQVAELGAGQSLVVGRSDSAQVKLDVRSLSREHARFVRDGDKLWVEDLDSRNGVMQGAQRVRQALLEPGSIVQLGEVKAVAHFVGPVDRRAPRAGSLRAPVSPPASALLPIALSPRMRSLEIMIQRVSVTDMPVLITGETGVGKELVAEAVHRASRRAEKPFRAVNCGAIPDSLLTSLLFGHERGAFTGANQTSKGLFEQAQGGTVFLDEVGELSPSTQAALLRVLETKRVTRLGAHSELVLDTRVIAATHRNLEQMSQSGAFRSDLLFRLNAFVLAVPPLRERQEEIAPLAEHFMRGAVERLQLPARTFTPEALASLSAYAWPGNVRELRNVVEHAMVMCEGTAIADTDMPQHVRASGEAPRARRTAMRMTALPLDSEGYRERVREYEVGLIVDGLRMSNGNQTQAAELLKLPLRTLVHKMKTYGIRRESDPQ